MHPTAFEFDEGLLLALNTHVYSCQFGNFLFNNQAERDGFTINGRTLREITWDFWDELQTVNPVYNEGEKGILEPGTGDLKVWNGLFKRGLNKNDGIENRLSKVSLDVLSRASLEDVPVLEKEVVEIVEQEIVDSPVIPNKKIQSFEIEEELEVRSVNWNPLM